ncbi:MAG: SGNH/GDSL hydrolase family protein [Arenibacterium sp.]
MIGDSILSWHAVARGSVGDIVAQETGRSVLNLAKSGARVSSSSPDLVAEGFDIRAQYRSANWEWVIINGGANDLISECGCRRCSDTLDALIDERAGFGEIVSLVVKARQDARHVMLLGYYEAYARAYLINGCADVIAELNARLARLARLSNGQVRFVAAADVINPNNRAHYYVDRIHPSRLGARLIGQRLAREMDRIDAGS